jgi:hypothetical protein
MVARDIAMQVSPKSFDAIVVRTVRGQKMELEALPLCSCQTHFNLVCGMDAVVVQNYMNDVNGGEKVWRLAGSGWR